MDIPIGFPKMNLILTLFWDNGKKPQCLPLSPAEVNNGNVAHNGILSAENAIRVTAKL